MRVLAAVVLVSSLGCSKSRSNKDDIVKKAQDEAKDAVKKQVEDQTADSLKMATDLQKQEQAGAFNSKIDGKIHSVGGELGTWDITLDECHSGEADGFFGVDFYVKGSDELRLRYVHDEAAGTVVKIGIPSKKDTAYRLTRDDGCKVLDGDLQKTNVTQWSRKGDIHLLNGNVKFDCPIDGGGHVTGDVTFTYCGK
jgi:hypothetical protein